MLRSMRYGEADRILHVFTPERGRVSAIAKGVRKARSRFGGRLEPFFRARPRALPRALGPADGHQRGDRGRPPRGCASTAGRSTSPPAPATPSTACSTPATRIPASTTCSPTSSALLDADPAAHATTANALAFRLKLLLAAGFTPQLAACATCGEREHLSGFSGAAGGVVCSACEAGSFALSQEAHDFLVGALGPAARGGARRAAAGARAGRAGDPRHARAPRAPAPARRRVPRMTRLAVTVVLLVALVAGPSAAPAAGGEKSKSTYRPFSSPTRQIACAYVRAEDFRPRSAATRRSSTIVPPWSASVAARASSRSPTRSAIPRRRSSSTAGRGASGRCAARRAARG